MFDKKEYLCLILDRETKKEIAEYQISAFDEYLAANMAAHNFEDAQRYQPSLRKHTNWIVDSCKLSP